MASVKRSGVSQGAVALFFFFFFLSVLAVAPNHPLMNYVLILLAFLLCGCAYLAYLLIGSVSMFDFGNVGVTKQKRECLGYLYFDVFVHFERAGRVRLNIKESTDPFALPVFIIDCLPKGLEV